MQTLFYQETIKKFNICVSIIMSFSQNFSHIVHIFRFKEEL